MRSRTKPAAGKSTFSTNRLNSRGAVGVVAGAPLNALRHRGASPRWHSRQKQQPSAPHWPRSNPNCAGASPSGALACTRAGRVSRYLAIYITRVMPRTAAPAPAHPACMAGRACARRAASPGGQEESHPKLSPQPDFTRACRRQCLNACTQSDGRPALFQPGQRRIGQQCAEVGARQQQIGAARL